MSFWSKLTRNPNKRDFAMLMIGCLRRAGESRPIEYDSSEFKLRLGDETQFFLANAYSDYRAAGWRSRFAVLSRYAESAVSSLIEMPGSYEAARSKLLPVVRSLGYHGLNRLRTQSQCVDPARIPVLPLADPLAVSLAYDTPHSIRAVSQDELSKWNTSFSEALAEATENLRQMSSQALERLANGVYESTWRDCYDASRLSLTDLVWGLNVDGDYIAA